MRPTIESLHNPKVKLVLRLRESRARRKSGLILIDGKREIERALHASVNIQSILVTPENASQWPDDLVQPVLDRVFEKLTYGDRCAAVAIAEPPFLELAGLTMALQSQRAPLLLVLDRAEKPGNIGAVVRTVATSGASGVVLVDPQCEVFNPNAIRASLGTVFSVPLAVTTLDELAGWLAEHQIRLVRACVDGSVSMWSANLTGPLAIALGSEAWGLGPDWDRPGWPAVQIPMTPEADSLNLSVSAAVLCYEALRQRGG